MAGKKRMHIDEEEANDSPGETHGNTTSGLTLYRPRFYSCEITLTRRQHLTINQYKPGEDGEEYKITVLPYTLFAFWAQDPVGTGLFSQPYQHLAAAFPLCRYHSASLRISNFIPLQKSLQATSTAVDTTTFNIAPYMYIGEDPNGVLTQFSEDKILIDEACMKAQAVKYPSKYFWPTKGIAEGGLLMLPNLQTLSSKEIYEKHWKLDPGERLFHRTPEAYKEGTYYLPLDLFGISGSQAVIDFAKSVRNESYIIKTKPEPDPGQLISNFTGTPTHTEANPIVMFLPFIESVSSSEDVTRMMAHILMETQIRMTLFTPTDGYMNYFKTSFAEPIEPVANAEFRFQQQQTYVPTTHKYTEKMLRFSNFIVNK